MLLSGATGGYKHVRAYVSPGTLIFIVFELFSPGSHIKQINQPLSTDLLSESLNKYQGKYRGLSGEFYLLLFELEKREFKYLVYIFKPTLFIPSE